MLFHNLPFKKLLTNKNVIFDFFYIFIINNATTKFYLNKQ